MKRIFVLCSVLVFCSILLIGCKNGSAADNETEQENVLSDNYYLGGHDSVIQVVKFHSDMIVEWVDCTGGVKNGNREKTYGTYEIEERKLIITLSGQEPMSCVIHEEGESLTIDGSGFKKTEMDKLTEKTANAFD